MILGHQKQWQFLKRLVKNGKVPHAFLFSGQSQLGKKKVAFEFLKLLNCQEKNRPCQVCRNCQEIEKKSYPDLIFITPLKKEIQISQIRELSWKLSLRPYSAPLKAAILDQAHLMNQETQSSFLKTLEEPKGKTVFILVTEFPERLFPTIISRCQTLKFYPVPLSEIKEYLLNQGASEDLATKISQLSFGKPGRAIDFLLNPEKIRDQKRRIKEIETLSNSDLSFRFQYAKEISQDPQVLKETLDIWLEYFREILLKTVKEQIKYYSLAKLRKILKLLQTTKLLISTTNINPRLALEILLLEL